VIFARSSAEGFTWIDEIFSRTYDRLNEDIRQHLFQLSKRVLLVLGRGDKEVPGPYVRIASYINACLRGNSLRPRDLNAK